jgi:hypothetical protein
MDRLYLKQPCNPRYEYPTVVAFLVQVTDENPPSTLDVKLHWSGTVEGSLTMALRNPQLGTFYGQIGPFGPGPEGTIKISVVARDKSGLRSVLDGLPIALLPCLINV